MKNSGIVATSPITLEAIKRQLKEIATDLQADQNSDFSKTDMMEALARIK